MAAERSPGGFRVGVGGVRISALAKRRVREALDAGRLSYGPYLKAFESRFAALHGRRWGVTASSGTAALHVALAALQEKHGWKPGDEVLVPAVTFVATANMPLLQGLRPVFVDVDPRTYNMDPEQAERRVTRRTRLLLPAHLFGQPCDMGPLMSLARRKGLKVLEDSCETMFARWRGRPVGSFGDAACFSTFAAHILVTGVGGLAVTGSAPLAVLMRSLVNHGRDSIYLSPFEKGRGSRREVLARRFRFERLGFSYRLTELEGALGLTQLEEHRALLARRRANAAGLLKGLAGLEDRLQLPWWPKDVEHSFMMFPLLASSAAEKRALTRHLEGRGIETRDMLPLTSQPYLRRLYGELEPRYPAAREVNRRGFYIGCHPGLTPADLDHVLEAFHDFYRRRG